MKKRILTILQVLATLAILLWIFKDQKTRAEMWAAAREANFAWLLVGIGAYGVVELLALVRWQFLMRAQGIFIPWRRMGALLMIGIFFNVLMPGGVGGDVVKLFFLLKETSKKAQALLAVLFDRLVGLVGLMLISALILGFKHQWLQQTDATRKYTWALTMILIVSLSGVIVALLISRLGLAKRLPAKLPLRDKLLEVVAAFNQYAAAWKICLLALLLSFGVHLASFYTYFAAALALSTKVPVVDFFSIMPIINTITSLPISVGGAGWRELLFVNLLGDLCAIPRSQALGLSVLGYLITVFWAGVGLVIYLFYRPSEHEPIRAIEHEVQELEHKIAEEQ